MSRVLFSGSPGMICPLGLMTSASFSGVSRARSPLTLPLLTAWQAPTVGAYPMSSPSVAVFDDSELVAAAADETVPGDASPAPERVSVA